MRCRLRDGQSLYLIGRGRGYAAWLIDYRTPGTRKENTYTVGRYGTGEDEFTLAKARLEREKVRAWLANGLDPNIEKKAEKARAAVAQGQTFAVLAREWLEKNREEWSNDHAEARRRLLERDLIPALGALPLAELESSPASALAALQRVEARGAYEIASKARIVGSLICRHGIITGRMTQDPFGHLGKALKRPPVKNRATISFKEMPLLFRAVAKVPSELNTKLALYWLLLTACRTGEMRFATWSEIEDGKTWRIPAERMKMRLPHVVPLSNQARQVLERAAELRTSPEESTLLFPGFTRHGALSENALLALLARAGYFGRQTAHGFRASFSTWAHETREADPDVIEACLAHVKEGVRGVYNRAAYLSRRRELLQAWANQLETWGLKLL
jgi:integrase